MRLFTIISGIMLVITGLFCFANPGETFLSLAFVLGVAMILTGAIQCASYWWGRDSRKDNNGWIFAEAIISLILGILVLTSQIAADAAIPMVFGLWVIFSGVLRFVVATMINPKTKKANFIWTMLTAWICIIGGLYAFLNPYIANVSIAVLLGILFLIQGLCTFELGIHMPHEKKEKKSKPKARAIKIQIKKPAKKHVEKKENIFDLFPPVDLKPDEISQTDVEKYKTEEIKLDDIRQALEFNFGADTTADDNQETAADNAEQNTDEPAETDSEDNAVIEEQPVEEQPAEQEVSEEELPQEEETAEEILEEQENEETEIEQETADDDVSEEQIEELLNEVTSEMETAKIKN